MRHAPRQSINRRTGVLKLKTARGKAYGAIVGMMDGSSRLARQKFTTDHEARAYRTALQERYEVFDLTYQLRRVLEVRPWWRKLLDWLRVGPRTLLVWRTRDPAELDIAERQHLAKQIRGTG